MKTQQHQNIFSNARWALPVLSALILGLVLFSHAPLAPCSPGPVDIGKIEPAIKGMAIRAAHAGELIPAIVQFYDDTLDDDQATSIIQGKGGRLGQYYSGFAAASADLDPAGLDELAQDPRVRHISYDHTVRADLDTTVKAIGVDQVRTLLSGQLGISGSGVTVAVIDSGIARAWDLEGSVLTKQVAFGPRKPDDQYGHGTHVAGIITGDGLEAAANPDYPPVMLASPPEPRC